MIKQLSQEKAKLKQFGRSVMPLGVRLRKPIKEMKKKIKKIEENDQSNYSDVKTYLKNRGRE